MAKKRKPRRDMGSTGSRIAGLPVASKVVQKAREEERKAAPKAGALTMDEKFAILEEYEKETDTNLIAQKFNRSPEAIRKFIWRYKDTTKIARARLQGGAEELADRIVEMANVDQALEVMDRLDVLTKKRDKAAPASSFNLIMGFGIQPSSGKSSAHSPIPIPSQKQIDDAIEGEARVVTSGKG